MAIIPGAMPDQPIVTVYTDYKSPYAFVVKDGVFGVPTCFPGNDMSRGGEYVPDTQRMPEKIRHQTETQPL